MGESGRNLRGIENKSQRIHFVGIGGIGMSGIAEVLLTLGYAVSGSDLRPSPVTDRLAGLGAVIHGGHLPEQVRNAHLVVTSSAIAPDNCEFVEARRLGIPVIPRAEMLAELLKLKYGIAVTGAHGKTTVSSMVAVLLASANLDPTAVIGGRLDVFRSNARLGKSRFMVVEADESDRSFLHLEPTLAILTNLDREHLDQYQSVDDIASAFVAFARRVPSEGAVILCADDERLLALRAGLDRRVITYGLARQAEVRASEVELYAEGSYFNVRTPAGDAGRLSLRVPGIHNVTNSLAAVAVGWELGIPFEKIRQGMDSFRGVDRRLQVRARIDGIVVMDDYCHHPSEIKATVEAALLRNPRRLWAVFQPHRYSRTAHLMSEFSPAFQACQRVDVLDIYAAGEAALPGIAAERLVERMRAEGCPQACYAPDVEELIAKIIREAQPGDLIVTMGAGSISKWAVKLVKAFEYALSTRQAVRP